MLQGIQKDCLGWAWLHVGQPDSSCVYMEGHQWAPAFPPRSGVFFFPPSAAPSPFHHTSQSLMGPALAGMLRECVTSVPNLSDILKVPVIYLHLGYNNMALMRGQSVRRTTSRPQSGQPRRDNSSSSHRGDGHRGFPGVGKNCRGHTAQSREHSPAQICLSGTFS